MKIVLTFCIVFAVSINAQHVQKTNGHSQQVANSLEEDFKRFAGLIPKEFKSHKEKWYRTFFTKAIPTGALSWIELPEMPIDYISHSDTGLICQWVLDGKRYYAVFDLKKNKLMAEMVIPTHYGLTPYYWNHTHTRFAYTKFQFGDIDIVNSEGELATSLALGHSHFHTQLSWSPDDHFIAHASKNHVYVWNIEEEICHKIPFECDTSQEIYHALAYSHDGKFLAYCAGSRLLIFTTDTWQLVKNQIVPMRCCSSLAWSDRYLAVGGSGVILLLDRSDWQVKGNIAHQDRVSSVVFLDGGTVLASTSKKGIRLTSLTNGEQIMKSLTSLSFEQGVLLARLCDALQHQQKCKLTSEESSMLDDQLKQLFARSIKDM